MANPVGLTLVSGQYTCTWSGTAFGIFEGDASVPTLEITTFGEKIANTDAFGKTPVDLIYQGMQGRWQATAMEYKSGNIAIITPWSGTMGKIGVIGVLATGAAAALVMTALSGTPAAAAPASVTASYAILSPQFPIKLLYGPTLRKIPMMMDLYPYVASSANVFWTQS